MLIAIGESGAERGPGEVRRRSSAGGPLTQQCFPYTLWMDTMDLPALIIRLIRRELVFTVYRAKFKIEKEKGFIASSQSFALITIV